MDYSYVLSVWVNCANSILYVYVLRVTTIEHRSHVKVKITNNMKKP